jgi:hypothetical protein
MAGMGVYADTGRSQFSSNVSPNILKSIREVIGCHAMLKLSGDQAVSGARWSYPLLSCFAIVINGLVVLFQNSVHYEQHKLTCKFYFIHSCDLIRGRAVAGANQT